MECKMSRSRRKNPIRTVCGCTPHEMKNWKKSCNRRMRRNISVEEDIGNGSTYKKINDIWDSPSDGKYRMDDPDNFDGTHTKFDPTIYRKALKK
jgi:hypothetical protein